MRLANNHVGEATELSPCSVQHGTLFAKQYVGVTTLVGCILATEVIAERGCKQDQSCRVDCL